MTEAEIYWNQVPAATDEMEALAIPPIEIDLDPLPRRLVFAALDAGPGVIRPPETDELVELPIREHAQAISTPPSIMSQAVDESADGVPEKEKSFSTISRFNRCKAEDGCGGTAFYVRPGGSYYKCEGEWCGAALVKPGKCKSCPQSLRRVKAPRGTIVCLDPACGKTSEYTDKNAEKRGLAAPPIQATSAATESKLMRSFDHEIEQHLDAMLACRKWGARTRVMLFIHSGGDDPTSLATAEWIRGEAARHAMAEGLKPPHGTAWTEPKVERGIGAVATELRKRLKLDDTTAYTEMAARFRRNGSQRLLDALADKLAADKRLRPLAKELGLAR